MPSVFLKTYGCQMNERDSEAVAAQLVARGYSLAPSEVGADVVLLNTCSVRDAAEQKAFGKMQTLAGEWRERRPRPILGFLGCLAQARGEKLLAQLPEVALVVGTQRFHHTVDYLDQLLGGARARVCDVAEEPGSQSTIREHLSHLAGPYPEATAFISIMQGCNQYCTFCIVPYTRGRERSRPIAEVVAEARELVASGVKEITLLGQIVTSYGKREIGLREGKSAFVQLLEAVHELDGLERIRFTSPHPTGYGDDLVAAFGRLPKLCESAHLPIQSGSNPVLKRMHRGYTVERCLELIEKLRCAQPRIALTTDLIVGFPGETEADFAATLDLVRQVEFDNAFLFKYSPRHDTPAAQMPEQVPQEVKEARHAELLRVVNELAARKYERMVGQVVEVLVEGPSRKNSARLTGRTRCNRIVIFDGPERLCGRLLRIRLERAGKFTLYGTPMDADTSGVGTRSRASHFDPVEVAGSATVAAQG